MVMTYLIFSAIAIMLMSLSGVFFVTKKFEDWTHKNLKYLVAFASGVFLIVAYGLVFEAYEFSINKAIFLGSLLFSFALFFIVEKSFPDLHCHHDDHKCIVNKNRKGAVRVLFGDAIHNFGDGLLLAPVFLIDIRLGLLATVGMLFHEFVQEISEFFILKSAGYSNKGALFINFIVSSSVLVGALTGYYLVSFENLIGPLIGVSAGAFIYIILFDLIPESLANAKHDKKYFKYIFSFALGILLILTVTNWTEVFLEDQGLDGHGHLEEVGHNHEEEFHSDDNHDEEFH